MNERENEVVQQTPGEGAEATPARTPEEVTSPEVKTEVQTTGATPSTVQKNEVDVSKMQEQINNLNTALKQAREDGKKTAELEARLVDSQETINKLKNVFSPEQKEETQHESLTLAEVEALLNKRDEDRKYEVQKESQAQAIQTEVKDLEKEWNGENGRPKYEDKNVLQWQEDNNKLHLSPREAFNEMARDTIIDWEIKNRMSKKPEVQEVESPSGSPSGREPQATSPTDTGDLRSAVLEAMELAGSDNNN